MAVAAVKNGAWGFLEKPFQNNVLADKVIAAQQAALKSETEARARSARSVTAWSLQQKYADHLGITQRPVEFHRANIFPKLGVQSASGTGPPDGAVWLNSAHIERGSGVILCTIRAIYLP